MPPCRHCQTAACAALFVAASLWSGSFPSDKQESKQETWVEVASPHFTVMSNDGERTARRIAEQFEEIRLLYSKTLSSDLRLDPGIPIVIFATKNEKALSEIIPEFWAQKGHAHPSGTFLANPERNYIALRTDVEGEFPYLTVYHEYVHLIINLNFQHLPLWLNEGYATFLGSATLLPKGGRVGQPNESELSVLAQSKLLPLELLFRVGHDSPYYNEAEKTNVFYAESWALVHYLMTNEGRQKDHQLGKYIQMVEQGGDPVASAKSAFGDLGQLKKELDSYTGRNSYSMYAVALPDPPDSRTFPARTVPPAEADSILGDFDVSRGRLETAREKIAEALKLDPNSAAAQESMGLLLFRENKRDEAQKYFSRAVSLDAKDTLAYYYDGMLLVSNDEGDPDEARTALEKAVALKPDLAPAWDALAALYVSDPEASDKALAAAQRAVRAMPGELRYQFNLAAVLLQLRRYVDARLLAERLAKSSDAEVTSRARQLLDQLDHVERSEQENAYLADRGNLAPRAEVAAKSPEEETAFGGRPGSAKTGAGSESNFSAKGAAGTVNPVDSAPPEETTSVTRAHSYSMIGTVTAVKCSHPPDVQITLQAGAIVMRLHAANFAKLELKRDEKSASAARLSCAQLQGEKALARYRLVTGKSWDGEISSMELQGLP